MAPEVFFGVCYADSKPAQAIKDLHTFTPAILDGHCRHRVEHADYPGIIAEEGHTVRGIYATGLTEANMEKLDYFEGSEYERVQVDVKLLQKNDDSEAEVLGETRSTSAYIFKYPEQLERGEWDFEHFRKEKMIYWSRGDWKFEQGQ